jgi:hypothetical protein
MTRIQERPDDEHRAIFLCRSGNTHPSVAINAAATLLVTFCEWRPRLPAAPPAVGQQK